MAEYNPWKKASWNLTNQMQIDKYEPRKAARLRFLAEYPEYDDSEARADALADLSLRQTALAEAIRNHPGESAETTVHEAAVYFDFLKSGIDPTLASTDPMPVVPPVDPINTTPDVTPAPNGAAE